MQETQYASGQSGPPNLSVLHKAILGARRRIVTRRVLRLCSRVLCAISIPCALSVAASKLRWIEQPSPIVLGGVMIVSVIAALIYALTRPLTDIDVARITDQRTDLKERLSSALEFSGQGVAADAPFYHEQFADAEHYAGVINLKMAFPVKITWETPVGVVCALAVFLTYFLPTLPMFWTPQHKLEVAEVKKRGIEIEKLAKDSEKAADQQKLDETRKAAAEARKLGEEMKKGKIDKKQSLVALSKLTKKMEETQKRMAEPVAKKSLAEAHKDFQKALDKMNQEKKEEEQKKAEEMKKLASKGQQPPRDMQKPGDEKNPQQKQSEAMREAKQSLQKMADALANQDHQQMKEAMQKLAEQVQKGEMSKSEMKQLQQAMQQLSQSLKDTNQQQAAEMMQQASEMMQGSSMDSKTLQQVAQMMNQAGKQMGKGQPSSMMLDSKALGDLAQMLKDGRLTQPMGKGGNGNGGNGPGRGFNGHGGPSTAMKDPGATNPILVAKGIPNANGGKGKQGSAAEFAKYLATTSAGPKKLPNGKVAGVRSENGNELQMSMTGDPQAARSNSPYYQVVQSSKKQAESTLDKENIPASLKKQVKDYFDSIR